MIKYRVSYKLLKGGFAEVEQLVNDNLKLGWVLYGSPVYWDGGTVYGVCQAMIHSEEVADESK